MDKEGDRGFISGILGTSHIHQQRDNKAPQLEEMESSSESRSDTAPPKTYENSDIDEKPKLHRLGSYIDWGESKFDFSNATNDSDLDHYQTLTSISQVIPPGAGKMSSFASDDNFQLPLSAYKNIDHNAIPKGHKLSIPRQNSIALSKRRKSMLDTAEDEKIDGAAQAFLSGSPALKSPPLNMLSSNDTARQGTGDHSILEGLMGSWFFRNKTLEEDDASNMPKQTQVPMEGIGGGALTSRIMTELNITPNSKPEVEKMNTWAPASF